MRRYRLRPIAYDSNTLNENRMCCNIDRIGEYCQAHLRPTNLPPCSPCQHDLRNRNADLLRRFEIDDELEFDRLLEGNISWFDAVETSST